MARELVLLTAADCHLCARARRTLDELGVAWVEVSEGSDEAVRLAERAPPLRPALFDADGRLVAYGRLSERRLHKDLAADGRVRAISAGCSRHVHGRDGALR